MINKETIETHSLREFTNRCAYSPVVDPFTRIRTVIDNDPDLAVRALYEAVEIFLWLRRAVNSA